MNNTKSDGIEVHKNHQKVSQTSGCFYYGKKGAYQTQTDINFLTK